MTDKDQLIRTDSAASGASGASSNQSTPSSETEQLQKSVRKNGRFINPWPDFKLPTNLGALFKFLFLEKDGSKVPGKQELDRYLPVVTPNKEELLKPPAHGIRATWIGHATVLVQFDGISILTDPVFSQRCSPVQFAGPKRYRDVPCTIHDLPKINAVVISHTHYDHLDYNSVTTLNARFGSELRWFVPLGLAEWMNSLGCENVIEMDWWDENCIPEHPNVKFVFTPAAHWCKRTTGDDNKVLWGSWTVIGPWHKFFFCGDTGYCHVFKQIGRKFGPFDFAAIPIGAYEPRWFMKCQHINPEDAVLVHQDIKAKKSLAIHWGTFNLSYEFYLEPPEKLKEALKARDIPDNDFFILKHGESRLIGDDISSVD